MTVGGKGDKALLLLLLLVMMMEGFAGGEGDNE